MDKLAQLAAAALAPKLAEMELEHIKHAHLDIPYIVMRPDADTEIKQARVYLVRDPVMAGRIDKALAGDIHPKSSNN